MTVEFGKDLTQALHSECEIRHDYTYTETAKGRKFFFRA